MWIRTREPITKGWKKNAWIIPALGLAYSIYQGQTNKGGGSSSGSGLNYGSSVLNPDYYLSEFYSKPQEDLYGAGKSFLAGQPGPYYSPIGEIGGQSFENLLNLVKGDVGKGVTEDMARRNIRGGVGTRAIAKTTGDIATKMRWADFERALAGRKWMFQQGKGALEGVRGAGLSESQLKNQFNLNKAELALKLLQMEEETAKSKGSIWSNIFSKGIGSISNIMGMFGGGGDTAVSDVLGSAEGGGLFGTSSWPELGSGAYQSSNILGDYEPLSL